MKTNDWIDVLAHPAAQMGGVSPWTQRSWLAAGALLSLLLCLMLFGVNASWTEWLSTWRYEFKAGFALVVLLLSAAAWTRLLKPGANQGTLLKASGAIWLLVLLAASVLPANDAPSTDIFQGSWKECAPSIVLLALPVWLVMWRVAKDQAPVHLRSTGAAMGAVAGGAGALIYSLHCTEFAPMFVAVWYGVGMAFCALLGLLLAPRILRW